MSITLTTAARAYAGDQELDALRTKAQDLARARGPATTPASAGAMWSQRRGSTTSTVVRLIAKQFPRWAELPVSGIGVGDPAIDMLPAWAWLTPQTRDLFRAQVDADDATWAPGRGWGLGLALGAVHYYRVSNTVMAANGEQAISRIIADYSAPPDCIPGTKIVTHWFIRPGRPVRPVHPVGFAA